MPSTCESSIGQFPCRGVRITATPSVVVVELMRGVDEGVVFMGVAFRWLPVERSQLRLPQSPNRALAGSTHRRNCVHGSHLLPIDNSGTLTNRRRGAPPALRRLPCSCRTRRPTVTPQTVKTSLHSPRTSAHQRAIIPTDAPEMCAISWDPALEQVGHLAEVGSALRQARLLAGAGLSGKPVTVRLGVELVLHLGDVLPLRLMHAL